jgi:hypothetical protein
MDRRRDTEIRIRKRVTCRLEEGKNVGRVVCASLKFMRFPLGLTEREKI